MNKDFKTPHILHNKVKIIDQNDINITVNCARLSPSYRSPILLNKSFTEKPQRFVNCLTKNTYVRPHNHTLTDHWELMSWLDGIVYVIFFDSSGTITDKIKMSYDGVRILEIPPEVYHSFVTPDFGSYLEVRNCAYEPEFDRVYAPWSPPEKSKKANDFVTILLEFEETSTNIVEI